MEYFTELKKMDSNFVPPFALKIPTISFGGNNAGIENNPLMEEFHRQGKEFRKEIRDFLSKEEGEEETLEKIAFQLAIKLVSLQIKHETDLIQSGKQKGLTSVPNIKNTFESVKEKYKQLTNILKKVWGEGQVTLLPQEESLLATYLRLDSDDFKEFISYCSLYDKCFFNQNKQIIQVAMDEFKKDIPFFIEWISKENEFFLNDKRETEHMENIDHIFHNFVFAEAVLKNIPPESWTNDVVSTLGTWVVREKVTSSYIREFSKKLEKCPVDKIKNYFANLSEIDEADIEKMSGFSFKGLLTLLPLLKEEQSIREANQFFEEKGSFIMEREAKNLTFDEWKKLAKFLSKSSTGIEQLINFSMKQENPLIWRLYSNETLDKEDLKNILSFAIKNNRRDFLMVKKSIHFSKEFPYYNELREFFKNNSAQGTCFLNSFSWQGDSVDTRCSLLKDFITSKSIYFYYCQNLNLFHHMVKNKSHYKILSFCYGENADTNSAPKSQIDEKNLKKLWLHQDENGKTPWHYICERKDTDDKIYFQRRFKELSKLFLASCDIRDKDGKTPLDYALSDNKFMKNLLEKIPQVKDVLEKQGIQWSETRVIHKSEKSFSSEKDVKKEISKPVIPVSTTEIDEKVEQEEKSKIEEAIAVAFQKRQNLILIGRERNFALAYSVLRDVKSDETYRKDILEHIQKFLSTPQDQDFVIRGEMRWRPMKCIVGINELAISPLGCNAESMPRFYCKKELFTKQGKEYCITNRRQEAKKKNAPQPLTIWVATKKGDKRKQFSDAQIAQNMLFVNDGQTYSNGKVMNNFSWYTLDLSQPPVTTQVNQSLAIKKSGNLTR